MPNFLRLLLLASAILSLLTARWAYVRGQAPQRHPAVAVRPAPAPGDGPQWLPCANWCHWPASVAYRSQHQLATGPVVTSTL